MSNFTHGQSLAESVLRQTGLPIASIATALIFGLTLIYLIYSRESTPLREIPGPFLASLSKLWLVRKTRQLKRHEYDQELHKKYGSVVRVAPNQVIVSSPSALKTIYGVIIFGRPI